MIEKIDNYFQKKPLRNLLIKKGLNKIAKKEKKGLIFNFSNWHSEKDLFRKKYINSIKSVWMKKNN